jgi:GntR family transcriptional repressor for pyruvate dehydrogenase complex
MATRDVRKTAAALIDNAHPIRLIADQSRTLPSMTTATARSQLTAISTNDRATPSLVYRSLLRSIRDGLMVPGAKLPNERELAQQLNTSRTAVRSALAMMERQGLVRRRVGSGTYLTDDARDVFGRMDQTTAQSHETVPSFAEIVEGRLLFEPGMMHLVVTRVQEDEIVEMRRILGEILGAPTWEEFKESIYALHRQIFAATKNKFLEQIMASILDDRRAVLFDGHDTDKPAPAPVRQQTHKDLRAIVDAIAERNAKRAEELVADHLMRTLATINIWQ